jgi:hypothetical protein
MLRYMLCSHPGLYVPPESNFIPRVCGDGRPLDRQRAAQLLEVIRGYRPFWRDWTGPPPPVDELLAAAAEPTAPGLVDAFYRRYAAQFGATRWGDKSPFYVEHVALLASAFPDAKVVHIIRDGRDVVTSSLRAYRGRRYFYTDAYYHARAWVDRVAAARQAGRALPAGRYHELRYEELTADPEGQLRHLCDFRGFRHECGSMGPLVRGGARG